MSFTAWRVAANRTPASPVRTGDTAAAAVPGPPRDASGDVARQSANTWCNRCTVRSHTSAIASGLSSAAVTDPGASTTMLGASAADVTCRPDCRCRVAAGIGVSV